MKISRLDFLFGLHICVLINHLFVEVDHPPLSLSPLVFIFMWKEICYMCRIIFCARGYICIESIANFYFVWHSILLWLISYKWEKHLKCKCNCLYNNTYLMRRFALLLSEVGGPISYGFSCRYMQSVLR